MSHTLHTLRTTASYLGMTAAFAAILSVTAFATDASPVRLKTADPSHINFPPIDYGESLWLKWPPINASNDQSALPFRFDEQRNELLPSVGEKQPCRSIACRPADPLMADGSAS